LRSGDLLKLGTIWIVINGEQISFWNDNWVESRNLADNLEPFHESMPQSGAKVSDFILNQSQWNISLLKQVLNNDLIVYKIKGIVIPVHAMDDSFRWELNNSDEFFTKSTTWIAHGL